MDMDTSDSWNRIPGSASPADWASEALEQVAGGRADGMAKRWLDCALALSGLVLLFPVMLLAAIAVRATGPVFHVSRRVGRQGRVFRCVKFRTMTADGRVTAAGEILRRYGLDEIPQLINVLRGEMSVVGPRPVMAANDAAQIVQRLRRFDTNPGMTGLWAMPQVEWTCLGPYLSPDETYRRNWSVWLDLSIVMRSLGAALAGRGR